jgi:enhancing lycopene biosynthesis protein 2
MCAGIDLLRKWKAPNLLKEETKTLKANEFCYDRHFKVYYTSAFRKSSNISEIQEGIGKMILSIIKDLSK